MILKLNIFEIVFELCFEFQWHKNLSGTRKKYIEVSFMIHDLRI